jgi:hypothetical protein
MSKSEVGLQKVGKLRQLFQSLKLNIDYMNLHAELK